MRSGGKWAALLVILLVLTTATLAGVASMYVSVREARNNTALLRYNARRGDCIRDVQGDAEQQFRKDIADLLSAGRDPAKYEPFIARMQAAAQVNYADTVKKVCPPALKGS